MISLTLYNRQRGGASVVTGGCLATGQPSSNPAIRISDSVDTLRFMFGVGIECLLKIEGGVRVDELRNPRAITRIGGRI